MVGRLTPRLAGPTRSSTAIPSTTLLRSKELTRCFTRCLRRVRQRRESGDPLPGRQKRDGALGLWQTFTRWRRAFPGCSGPQRESRGDGRPSLAPASAAWNVPKGGTGSVSRSTPPRGRGCFGSRSPLGATLEGARRRVRPDDTSGCFTRRWRSSRCVSARSGSMRSGFESRTVAGDYVTTALRRQHGSSRTVTAPGLATPWCFQPLPRTTPSAGLSTWLRTMRATPTETWYGETLVARYHYVHVDGVRPLPPHGGLGTFWVELIDARTGKRLLDSRTLPTTSARPLFSAGAPPSSRA